LLTFPNVSPAAFALVLDQLSKEGTHITSNAQNIGGKGRYEFIGHHFPLGDIRASATFDGASVTVDAVYPKVWESAIGERIGKSIEAAQKQVAGEAA
jgi:hypothetical protein